MAETQNMHDYPKKTIDRVKAVDPAQPTIDLKFDTKYVQLLEISSITSILL